MRLGVCGLAAFVASVIAGEPLTRFDLEEPYITDAAISNYDFGGSTVFSRRGVRLTGDIQDQRGWISTPSNVLLPPEFELEIDFRIEGESKKMFGDGMALWLLDSSESVTEGPVFGLKDYFKGTLIAIDTYRNHRPGKLFPLIVLSQNDGTHSYDIENDGKENEIASCSARGLHSPTKETSQLRIKYEGGKLKVEVNYRGRWDSCMSQKLNIPPGARFALSGSTGQLTESHMIRGIHAWSLGSGKAPAGSGSSHMGSLDVNGRASSDSQDTESAHNERYRQSLARKANRSGTWFEFLFKLGLFVGGIYAAYKYWLKYKEAKENERFKLA